MRSRERESEKEVERDGREKCRGWGAQLTAGGRSLLLELEPELLASWTGFGVVFVGQLRQKCPMSPQEKQN